MTRPLGQITRGTTAPRRLRRLDRWLVAAYPALLRRGDLVVADLGFGASPITTLELASRLRAANPTVRVVGLDIDPARVASAQPAATPAVAFRLGGFELAGLRPHLVRAANVLRQYDEGDVAAAWTAMAAALAPGGVIVDATLDEAGRLGSWISLDASGPRSLTLAVDLTGAPERVATRLPKALIHRNTAGTPVHDLITAVQLRWQAHAGLRVYGGRQRFAAAVRDVRAAGWPVLDGPGRWRRGELTVAWPALTAR